jgi:multidrug efflux pump subunit AcrA (membrane-fusion protein)
MKNMKRSRWRPPDWVAIGGLFFGLALPCALPAEEPEAGEEHSPVHVSHEANGVVVLTLGAETQEHIELKVEAIEAKSLQPTIVAYGRLEQDPAGSFAIRAPIAGVLRAASEHEWPGIGTSLESGTNLGFVEARFSPLEMADMQSRLMDALADIEEVQADLDAARASFENKSRLNTEGGLVSDRSLEEAQARYKSAEARLAAARKKENLYESLVKGQGQVSTLFPVLAPQSGEVVEVSARPGEVVDAGQLLLRTVRTDALIVRVSLFVGDFVEAPLTSAQVAIPGMESSVLVGEPVGSGAESSAMTGGQVLLYRVHVPEEVAVRPGTAVQAHIATSGTAINGVLVPRSCLLRHAGLTWVYVQTGDDRFERRDCVLHTPLGEGWFVSKGVAPGEKVVVEGAQMLLSEELKSQIEFEEAAEE